MKKIDKYHPIDGRRLGDKLFQLKSRLIYYSRLCKRHIDKKDILIKINF